MSTKGHLLYTDHIEIYEETSEPINRWGRFAGYTIYILAEIEHVESFCIGPRSKNYQNLNSMSLKMTGMQSIQIPLIGILEIDFLGRQLEIKIDGSEYFIKEKFIPSVVEMSKNLPD